MRFYIRPELDESLLRYLAKKQREIKSPERVEIIWSRARRTQKMKRVAAVLSSMTGVRERCMYCADSRGTDIDHYRPKSLYLALVFAWPNMLLTCALCNRLKTRSFPLDHLGVPLLLNPTLHDPWLHLVYDSKTDELAPRWDALSGMESAMGIATLAIISSLKHQAVNEGRGRTRRNLVRAVNALLASSDEELGLVELKKAISDNDCYGLVDWFFRRDGQEETPFKVLRDMRTNAWASVVAML
jgi:hypothetical protein